MALPGNEGSGRSIIRVVVARAVYSTDKGRLCPGCGWPFDDCRCSGQRPPTGDGIARVRRETKGRGGKTVTTVSGIPLGERELRELTKSLKRRCGTGGTLKDGVIEIQGDHRDAVRGELEKRGFEVKLAGG